MTVIDFNVTGAERKRLAQALGQILGWEPVYQGAPTFGYAVGSYIVSKDGAVSCPDVATDDIVQTIIDKLREEGFTAPASAESDALTISLPRNLFDDATLSRLEQIISSKAELFKRAFQTDVLLLEKSETEISFPWFKQSHGYGDDLAYGHFVSALGEMARKRQRIIAKPYEGGNDKFTMRLFLVQLGLVGDEYKQTRKVLLMNLEGNSAWKNGPPPPVPDSAALPERIPLRPQSNIANEIICQIPQNEEGEE